ncbi:MAG: hypothetical protein ABJH05_07635 [Fulvivirga sp.]
MISINQGYYFPLPFRIFGGALPVFSLVFLTQSNYILAVLGVVMAFLLLTTKYQIILDLKNKNYFEHLWILGFKRGEMVNYNSIEKLVIGNRNKSKTYNSRGSTNTVRYTAYYLCLLIDGNRVELLESEKEENIDKLKSNLVKSIGQVPAEDLRG